MIKFILIISLLVLILLFPIPIKIKMQFMDNNLQLFLFNKKINLEKIKNNINNESKINKKNTRLKFIKKFKNNNKTNKKQKEIQIKAIFNSLYNMQIKNIFKPKLALNYSIVFGLDDAANTALLYGFSSGFGGFVYNLLTYFFKIKNYKYSITPNLTQSILIINFNSIFSVNLAKIIYISIIFIKSYNKFKKE